MNTSCIFGIYCNKINVTEAESYAEFPNVIVSDITYSSCTCFTFAVRYALNSETDEAGSFGGTTQHRGITVSEMFSGIAKEDR